MADTRLLVLLSVCSSAWLPLGSSKGMLYPQDSESRVVKTLDGMWRFRVDTSSSRNQSFVDQWWTRPLAEVSEKIEFSICLQCALLWYFYMFTFKINLTIFFLSNQDVYNIIKNLSPFLSLREFIIFKCFV